MYYILYEGLKIESNEPVYCIGYRFKLVNLHLNIEYNLHLTVHYARLLA